jgi:ACS family pantothenate transporter-like MFS transporter
MATHVWGCTLADRGDMLTAPSVLFPQVEQPRVFKGNVATVGIMVAMSASSICLLVIHSALMVPETVCVALATRALQRRDERRALEAGGDAVGEIPASARPSDDKTDDSDDAKVATVVDARAA